MIDFQPKALHVGGRLKILPVYLNSGVRILQQDFVAWNPIRHFNILKQIDALAQGISDSSELIVVGLEYQLETRFGECRISGWCCVRPGLAFQIAQRIAAVNFYMDCVGDGR